MNVTFDKAFIRTDAIDPENWRALGRRLRKAGGDFSARHGMDSPRYVELPANMPAEIADELFPRREGLSNNSKRNAAWARFESAWCEVDVQGYILHGPGFMERLAKLWSDSIAKHPRCNCCGVVVVRGGQFHERCKDCCEERRVYERAAHAADAAGKWWDKSIAVAEAVRLAVGFTPPYDRDAAVRAVYTELRGA